MTVTVGGTVACGIRRPGDHERAA